MKRYPSFLLALFAAVLLALPARAYGDAAFAALPFEGAGSGVTTVITDTQGAVHRFDGALDAAALDDHADEAVKIASYALLLDGAELLNVELHGFEAAEPTRGGLSLLGIGSAASSELTNGYFSAAFDYDAGDFEGCEVFLTGLGQDQLSELTGRMVDAALRFQKFDLTDLGFIDAEKLSLADSDPEKDDGTYSDDSELCWAATTSNILRYTGWAAKAAELNGEAFPAGDETTEDDLLNLFADNFTDGPGHVSFGLGWFFNGQYEPEDDPRYDASQWSRRRPENSGGNYLSKYPVSFSYSEVLEADKDPSLIETAAQRLREGWGVGIALAWYKLDVPEEEPEAQLASAEEAEPAPETYTREGGHAITFWGYIRRKGVEGFRFDKYLALLAADPDSDPSKQMAEPSDDRADAPDMLCLMPLSEADIMGRAEGEKEYHSIQGLWVKAAEGDNSGILEDFIVLKPYDPSFPTDDGTFDRKTSPDLTIEAIVNDEGRFEPIYLSDCAEDLPFNEGYRTVFAAGSDMSACLRLGNNSGRAPYIAPVKYALELRRGDGDFEPMGTGATASNTVLPGNYTRGVESERVALGTLSAGAYTLRVTIIPLELAEYQAYLDDLTFMEMWELVDTLTDAHPLEYLSAIEGRTIYEITSDYFYDGVGLEDVAAFEDCIVQLENSGIEQNVNAAAILRALPGEQLDNYLEYYETLPDGALLDVRARLIALTVGLDEPELYTADDLSALNDVFGEKLQTRFTEAYYTNNSKDFDFTVTDTVCDLSGVSVALAGDITLKETTENGTKFYNLPLTITGLDEDFAENCFTTVNYYYNGAWDEEARDRDAQAFGTSMSIPIQGLTKVRLRMQLQPSDPDIPWPVLTKELTLAGTCWFYVDLGAEENQYPVKQDGRGDYVEKDGEKFYIHRFPSGDYAMKDQNTYFKIKDYDSSSDHVTLIENMQYPVVKDGERYYVEKDGRQYDIEVVVEGGYYAYYVVNGEERIRIRNYVNCDYDLCKQTVRPWAPWSDSTVLIASYDQEGRMVSAAEQVTVEREENGVKYTTSLELPYGSNMSSLKFFWLGTPGSGVDYFAPKGAPITID